MGFSRWMQGSKDDAPGASGAEAKARGASATKGASGWTALERSDNWQALLQAAAAEAGRDGQCLLVTDAAGVEVQLGSGSEPRGLAGERFPLRLRRVARSMPAPGWKPSPPSESSATTASSKGKVYRGHQTTVEIQFEDVWPGLLRLTLEQHGARADGVVATDAKGVELDLRGARQRMPSPERFPLTLHFQAACGGPQHVSSAQAAEPRGRRNGSKGSTPLLHHSVDLELKGVLRDILDLKLEDMGLHLAEEGRSRVLLTDALGVVIDSAAEVPRRQSFPLKAYIESRHLIDNESPEGLRWSRFSEKGPGSRSTGGPVTRATAAAESAWRSFKRVSGMKASE